MKAYGLLICRVISFLYLNPLHNVVQSRNLINEHVTIAGLKAVSTINAIADIPQYYT